MSEFRPPRSGEVAIDLPESFGPSLYVIGRIRTPWATLAECPKYSRRRSDVLATIELDQRFEAGLKDISLLSHLIILYRLHLSRRDLILQAPSHVAEPRGVFALRSPVRPNPIGLSVVELVEAKGSHLKVRNLDCVDGTPVLDIKPYFATTDSFPDAKRP